MGFGDFSHFGFIDAEFKARRKAALRPMLAFIAFALCAILGAFFMCAQDAEYNMKAERTDFQISRDAFRQGILIRSPYAATFENGRIRQAYKYLTPDGVQVFPPNSGTWCGPYFEDVQ